jgi:aminoglycoside phosphotransferase (APT) family kinase protein
VTVGPLSASLPEPLPAAIGGFLERGGLLTAGESPAAVPLTGGVSSDIWRVDLNSGPIVVKRALARLRVAQVWEAPVERNRYERMWLEEANAIVPGVAPKVLAADDAGLFAMEYFDGLPVWKAELREGRADAAFATALGRRLARIHSATAGRAEIAQRFATDANFHAIRLEPYLIATGKVHPALSFRLKELSDRTASSRLALVHGDVSPKNILVGPQGPVILDAECAWYGDPAFDVAFCLNHLLLKCLWVPSHRADYLRCFDALAQSYLALVDWEPKASIEARIASLLPGLLLARADGKSPAEYLTEADKQRVREFAGPRLLNSPVRISDLGTQWQES